MIKEKISADNRRVFIFEDDAGARSENPRSVYRDEVINSDIYIGIFKDKYSESTREEYEIALKGKKDIFIYVYHDGKGREKELQAFLTSIKENHTWNPFEDISDLIEKIGDDLEKLLYREYKKRLDQKVTFYKELENNDIYFIDQHTTFNSDRACWMIGHFGEGDIESNYDVRRPITDQVIDLTHSQAATMIFGRAFYGKTMLLQRVMTEERGKGRTVIFIGKIKPSTPLKKIISILINNWEKVLVIVDDCHIVGCEEIFKVYNDLSENDLEKVHFLFSARREEFEIMKENIGFRSSSEIEKASRKIHFLNLKFENEEAKLFVEKGLAFSNWELDPGSINDLSQKLFRYSQADPFIFYLLLVNMLSKHDVKFLGKESEILKRQLNDTHGKLNSEEYPISVLCCLLHLSNIRISNKIINDCGYTTVNLIALQSKSFLFKNFEYKTRHELWAKEFLLFLLFYKCDNDFTTFSRTYHFEKTIDSLLNHLDHLGVARLTYLCGHIKDKRFDLLGRKIISLIEEHEFLRYTDHVKADLFCFDIGTFYLFRQELEKANECYDKAIRLVPYHEAWNNKGFAYSLRKEYDNALMCFDKHLMNNPNDILAYINKSTVLIVMREYLDGLESCIKGLNREPVNADLWNNKGKCYHHLNLIQEAIECFDKALEIDKNHFKAWHSKGFSYYRLNKIEDALECYDNAIKINPNYVDAWFHKGLLMEDIDIAYSIKCYDNAIKINPNYVDAWFNLGSINLRTKDLDKAIKCFQNVLRISPTDPDALFSIAEAYSSSNCYRAMEYYDKALSLKQDFSIAWLNLGVAYQKKGFYDDSIRCYNKVILYSDLNDISYVVALENMGLIYLEQNRIHQALRCYDEILVLDPINIQSLYRRAVAKARIDDLNGAIGDLILGAGMDKDRIAQSIRDDPELEKVKGAEKIRELLS